MHFISKTSDHSELLGYLCSSIHQGISVVDRELNLIMINRTALEMLEIPDGIIVDDPSLEKVFRFNAERGDYGPGDPERLIQERVDLAKLFLPHDFVRTRPDGTVLRIQGTPMDNGGFVTIYSNVTAEYEQERALVKARARLEVSLDERSRELVANRDLLLKSINAIEDGLFVADSEGKILLANDKMYQIYPVLLEQNEQAVTTSEMIRSVFPSEPYRDLDALLDNETMWSERQFPDGRWYKISSTKTDDGGMLSVYSDVTIYKEQHSVLQTHTDELVRHLRKEKELNEMQREFVSMASHEFRTPLAIIDSNAQRILRKAEKIAPETLIERLGNIRESVERMQYLINRFLNFSQSESVGMEIDRESVSIRMLIESVCERQEQIAKSHNFIVRLHDLPDQMYVDKKLMEQSVSNLLSNAVKYSPDGSTVTVTGLVSGSEVLFSFEDEGVGIPQDELPNIFKRYFRASTSSGIAGTGIGLNMTRMIVQKHGGNITVNSEVGKGTCITMSLPIIQNFSEEERLLA